MKKITVFALTIMLLTACQKDIQEMRSVAMAQDDPTTESAAVTRPISVDFYSSVNPTSPSLTCTLPGIPFGIANSGYFLHGYATHLGRVDSDNSWGLDGFCNLSTALILTTETSGQIVSANGDKITYTGDDVIDLTNVIINGGTTGTITGLWTITGGTGRFDGATGSFQINGTVNVAAPGGPTISFTGEGTITY